MFGMVARALGGAASKLGRGAVTATRQVANVPIVKSIAKQTAVGAALYGVGNALGGGGKGMPALPGGMPGLPATMGNRGLFRNDANVPDLVKQWTISKGDLKFYPRAPKGFVICYDEKGDPFALPKFMAKKLGWWKEGDKPPISVGEWNSVKRADSTVKKMRKIFRTTTRVDKAITGGKVNVAGKKRSK